MSNDVTSSKHSGCRDQLRSVPRNDIGKVGWQPSIVLGADADRRYSRMNSPNRQTSCLHRG